jgi:hypothetical protein
MPDYGYKIASFTLRKSHGRHDTLPLDFAGLQQGGGRQLYTACLDTAFAAERGITGSRGEYLELISYDALTRALLVRLKGGSTGDEYDIVASATGEERGSVNADDALTWHSRVLYIFPPDAMDGLLVSETRGNSHHGSLLNRQLERQLTRNHSLRMDVTHDVADGIGWRQVFKDDRAYVRSVEFKKSNPAQDSTSFPENSDITQINVEMQLSKGSGTSKKLTELLTSDKPDKHDDLKRIVGGSAYDSNDFDDEYANVVSRDGRSRKYRISRRPHWFNYHIDSPEQLSDDQFIQEVAPAAIETLAALGHNLPREWSATS